MYAALLLVFLLAAASALPLDLPPECMKEIQESYQKHFFLSKDKVRDHKTILKKVMEQMDFTKCMNYKIRFILGDSASEKKIGNPSATPNVAKQDENTGQANYLNPEGAAFQENKYITSTHNLQSYDNQYVTPTAAKQGDRNIGQGNVLYPGGDAPSQESQYIGNSHVIRNNGRFYGTPTVAKQGNGKPVQGNIYNSVGNWRSPQYEEVYDYYEEQPPLEANQYIATPPTFIRNPPPIPNKGKQNHASNDQFNFFNPGEDPREPQDKAIVDSYRAQPLQENNYVATPPPSIRNDNSYTTPNIVKQYYGNTQGNIYGTAGNWRGPPNSEIDDYYYEEDFAPVNENLQTAKPSEHQEGQGSTYNVNENRRRNPNESIYYSNTLKPIEVGNTKPPKKYVTNVKKTSNAVKEDNAHENDVVTEISSRREATEEKITPLKHEKDVFITPKTGIDSLKTNNNVTSKSVTEDISNHDVGEDYIYSEEYEQNDPTTMKTIITFQTEKNVVTDTITKVTSIRDAKKENIYSTEYEIDVTTADILSSTTDITPSTTDIISFETDKHNAVTEDISTLEMTEKNATPLKEETDKFTTNTGVDQLEIENYANNKLVTTDISPHDVNEDYIYPQDYEHDVPTTTIKTITHSSETELNAENNTTEITSLPKVNEENVNPKEYEKDVATSTTNNMHSFEAEINAKYVTEAFSPRQVKKEKVNHIEYDKNVAISTTMEISTPRQVNEKPDGPQKIEKYSNYIDMTTEADYNSNNHHYINDSVEQTYDGVNMKDETDNTVVAKDMYDEVEQNKHEDFEDLPEKQIKPDDNLNTVTEKSQSVTDSLNKTSEQDINSVEPNNTYVNIDDNRLKSDDDSSQSQKTVPTEDNLKSEVKNIDGKKECSPAEVRRNIIISIIIDLVNLLRKWINNLNNDEKCKKT